MNKLIYFIVFSLIICSASCNLDKKQQFESRRELVRTVDRRPNSPQPKAALESPSAAPVVQLVPADQPGPIVSSAQQSIPSAQIPVQPVPVSGPAQITDPKAVISNLQSTALQHLNKATKAESDLSMALRSLMYLMAGLGVVCLSISGALIFSGFRYAKAAGIGSGILTIASLVISTVAPILSWIVGIGVIISLMVLAWYLWQHRKERKYFKTELHSQAMRLAQAQDANRVNVGVQLDVNVRPVEEQKNRFSQTQMFSGLKPDKKFEVSVVPQLLSFMAKEGPWDVKLAD